MELPAFFLVDSLPVKAVGTEEGGMDILAYDPRTGKFYREIRYLHLIMLPGVSSFHGDGDVERVTEEAFQSRLDELNSEYRAKLGWTAAFGEALNRLRASVTMKLKRRRDRPS